ncbi:hypothetical protein D3C72_1012340 [compost metagenome]
MGHDFHPDLRAPLPGDVVNRVFGDALPGDVAATADAVEQERVVRLAVLEHRTAQLEPGFKLGEGPGRCVLDQLLVALGRHPQAALGEIDLVQLQVHRFGFAHPGTVQNPDDRGIPQALRPRIGSADRHQFLDQRTPEIAPLGQPCTGHALHRTHLQQMLLRDQAHAPRFVHHPAHRVDIERRRVRRIAVRTQGGHQRNDVLWLQIVPGNFLDIVVFEAQAVGGILQHITHGQLAGRRQSRQIQGQWIGEGCA